LLDFDEVLFGVCGCFMSPQKLQNCENSLPIKFKVDDNPHIFNI